MEKKIWHCFSVSDYKGGKLHNDINLTTDELLDVITDDGYLVLGKYVEGYLNDFELGSPDIKKVLTKLFKDNLEASFECNGEYAGYSGSTTPKIYVTSQEGYLEESFPTDEEIGNYMFNLLEYWVTNNG